jgi:hypothetical protein
VAVAPPRALPLQTVMEAKMKTCPDCGGEGVIEEQRCPTCGGIGTVPDEEDDDREDVLNTAGQADREPARSSPIA